MAGWSERVDELWGRIWDYLNKERGLKLLISSKEAKEKIWAEITKTLMEEIDPQMKELTPSEREALLERVKRELAREDRPDDPYLEEIQKKIDAQKAKEEKEKSLYWDKDKILKHLWEDCTERDSEMLWMVWSEWKITFPDVEWKFKWKTFKFFRSSNFIDRRSDGRVTKKEVDENPEWKEKLWSLKNVCEMLQYVREYMKAMGVEIDKDVDYENDLKKWEAIDEIKRTEAWQYLGKILHSGIWLKNENVAAQKNSRVYMSTEYGRISFIPLTDDGAVGDMLFRLSDEV